MANVRYWPGLVAISTIGVAVIISMGLDEVVDRTDSPGAQSCGHRHYLPLLRGC
jgi:hypothetical protein